MTQLTAISVFLVLLGCASSARVVSATYTEGEFLVADLNMKCSSSDLVGAAKKRLPQEEDTDWHTWALHVWEDQKEFAFAYLPASISEDDQIIVFGGSATAYFDKRSCKFRKIVRNN